MSRLMFVYLSGREKGKTRIFAQNHLTIGTVENCDLKLVAEEGSVLPEGVLADVYDEEGIHYLVPHYPLEQVSIAVNGDEIALDDAVRGHPLRDGDSIQFGQGPSSASILFQVMPENFSTAQLVRRGNDEVRRVTGEPVHPLTATLFVKELAASLWAEIPRRPKIIGGVVLTGLVGIVVVAVLFFTVTQYRLASQIDSLRQQEESEQARRQQDLARILKQQEEIDRLRELSEETRRFAQRISELYSPGVCLIVGSYTFVERGTGRVLRYETADDANEIPVDESGNLQASLDGAGPAVQIDYTGTGFLVREGVVATNKHVVRPWLTDPVAQIVLQQGGGLRPRLDTLKSFFPSLQKPFDLRELKISERYDIALCAFDQGDLALPILNLSTDDQRSIAGEPVVLLGFPTGVDGMLQRIDDEAERKSILSEFGDSAESVAAGLASRGLIRPLTTTGNVTDSLPGRIVHSAQTAEGGSGSPIFNREGRVIAINSAILATADGSQAFGGSNFGVPIKMTYEMLLSYYKADGRP